MIILFPIFFLYCIVRINTTDKLKNFEALVFAVSIWSIILFAETEIFSIFKLVSSFPVVAFWTVIDIVLIVISAMSVKKCFKSGVSIKNYFFPADFKQDKLSKCFLLGLSIIVITIGLMTVPYNWDSMRYHLPRIMMWMQNKSVAHYTTNDMRQLSSPMIAEFVNLNIYAITHSDRFFNLLQSFSYLFNIIGVSAISKEMGLEEKWRKLAVLLYVSTPIAFSEAFSTQVDNFATVWMVLFAYICLLLFNTEKLKFDKRLVCQLVSAGVCMGMGYLTKPSVCIGMVVFAVGLIIVRIIKHDKASVIIGAPILAGNTGLIVVLPEIIRNLITFNAISDPIAGQRQLVGTLNPLYLIVNLVKNICYGLPTRLLPGSDSALYYFVVAFAKILGVNLDDPTISEDGRPYHVGDPSTYGHDSAINPLIVWLFLIALVICIVSLIKRKKVSNVFCVCSIVSFVVFMTAVRWEMFETRYEVAYLTLLAPCIAFVFGKVFSIYKNERVSLSFRAVTGFLCIVTLISGLSFHAFIGLTVAGKRPEGYFKENYETFEAYNDAMNVINEKGYKNIGVYITGGQYDYPLWTMCKGIEKVKYVNEENSTYRYEDKSFEPDCIFWVADLPEDSDFIYHGIHYNQVHGNNGFYVLTADNNK